ncbi:MAG: hypothetical protein HKN01_01400 [Acidimicrobiia bacterium]|nr:hypothetical protein [Acidimicrobiia bacterium]
MTLTPAYAELMRRAYKQALYSPDPSTQNGAVIAQPTPDKLDHIWPGYVLGVGCNTFWRVKPDLERPGKYDRIEHAERSAIFDAVRAHNGNWLQGSTLVCLWAACADCARAIIGVGIEKIVTHAYYETVASQRWQESIAIADAMLEDAGVSREVITPGQLGPILFDERKVNL